MTGAHRPHGALGYVQLPTTDLEASIAFYRSVFGWEAEARYSSFTAPGLIGQWTSDVTPAPAGAGPLLWFHVDHLWPALDAVSRNGGAVRRPPYLDQGRRWLAEITDPCGTSLGLVATARTAQPQTLLAVRDVETSSRWYQQLLGLVSDHGGPEYERLLADGVLVMQLHRRDVEHHHGSVIEDPGAAVGNGVIVWFGEVTDFDGVVARAAEMDVPVVRDVHRNPPEGEGPSHREIWLRDPDGYTVTVASPDGEAYGAAT